MMVMRFGLLGTLRLVREDGTEVVLRAPMERSLLAALLLRPREIGSNAYLQQVLWRADPPASAQASLHNQVRRLRKALGPSGELLRTQPPGYLLDVQDEQIDIRVFEQGLLRGRAFAQCREWTEAATSLDEALGLWRGEPLTDITAEALTDTEVPRLGELRADAWQWRFDAALALGQHEDVLAELQRVAAAHPLRERLHGQLMLTYFRCGRTAEALAAFRWAHVHLAAELRIEPSAELRKLHRQILAADPDLLAGDADRGTVAIPVPAQLPPDLSTFTARSHELDQLEASWRSAPGSHVAVITGAGGIGKTTLALHWAHLLRGQFPDGQLYFDLQGFSPAAAITSGEALHAFLGALGISPERRPTQLAELTGLFRSAVAGKRVLVFLDNARDAEQVRPMLPGSSACLTIVTSRNALAGIVANASASSLILPALSHGESLELLAARVGGQRLAQQPEAAAQIADRCAGLPLALAVVAAQVLTAPPDTLASLAAELSTVDGTLSALAADDSSVDLRTVFASSYRLLSVQAAYLFRCSGVLPSSAFTAAAIASAAGNSTSETRRLAAEIASVGLFSKQSADTYTAHDLIRAFAAELIEAAPGEQATATGRVFSYYTHSAWAAAITMAPKRKRQDIPELLGDVHPASPATLDEAGQWFAGEYSNLMAVAGYMQSAKAFAELSALIWALSVYCNRAGLWNDQVSSQRRAIEVRGYLGDAKGVANAHRTRGQALIQLHALVDAEEQLQIALDGYLALGELDDASNALLDLAWVCLRRDDIKNALCHGERALTMATSARPYALNTVGWCQLLLGEHQQGLTSCREALALHQLAADVRGQAETWDSIAVAHQRLGHIDEAMDAFEQALTFYRTNWDRHGEAETLDHQAEAAAGAGWTDQAIVLWRQSLRIFESLGHSDAERVASKIEFLGTR